MPDKTPACTSCGRDLKAHCAHCTWWRCSNHVCAVELTDFRRKIRRLTNGVIERLAAD